MSNENKFMLRDILTVVVTAFLCGGSYFASSIKANEAFALAQENKAFGIARDKKHIDTREYARDYAYRKDLEIKKNVEKHDSEIHVIREENVETRVKLSHIEKNQESFANRQEKTIELLKEIIQHNKTGR